MNSSLCRALLALPLLCSAACASNITAQINDAPAPATTAAPVPQASQATGDPAASPQKPSSLIAPAVDHLSQVVSQVQLEKWKGSSRDETDSNLRSIEHNVSGTLPQLVTAADAQPASLTASLPLLRNLDALCAVMIRVSVAARGSAPTQQAEALNGALTALQSARNTLADQVQGLAASQEKQIASLTSTVEKLSAKTSTPAPQPQPQPTPKPRTKRKPAKLAAKPATSPL